MHRLICHKYKCWSLKRRSPFQRCIGTERGRIAGPPLLRNSNLGPEQQKFAVSKPQ